MLKGLVLTTPSSQLITPQLSSCAPPFFGPQEKVPPFYWNAPNVASKVRAMPVSFLPVGGSNVRGRLGGQ
jgi:hypothetical protein